MERPIYAPLWEKWLQRFWYALLIVWGLFAALVLVQSF
jgi:hypothetical protein